MSSENVHKPDPKNVCFARAYVFLLILARPGPGRPGRPPWATWAPWGPSRSPRSPPSRSRWNELNSCFGIERNGALRSTFFNFRSKLGGMSLSSFRSTSNFWEIDPRSPRPPRSPRSPGLAKSSRNTYALFGHHSTLMPNTNTSTDFESPVCR